MTARRHPLDSLIALHTSPRLSRAAAGLERLLGRPPGLPAVYFAAPLSNLEAIAETGFIQPRSRVQRIPLDCSSGAMQSRRSTVFLGQGDNGKPRPPVEVHDCNNFFWNPANTALDAFCRNSMLLGWRQNEIVVLEIPLVELRRHSSAADLYWATSRTNIAKHGERARHSSAPVELERPAWPWESILGVEDGDRWISERQAELLLLGTGERDRGGLAPLAAVSRCLAPTEDVARKARRICGRPSEVGGCFKEREALLESDQRVAEFFDRHLPLGFSLSKQLNEYDELLERWQLRLSVEQFEKSSIGSHITHGVQHVARVMFWAHHLASRHQGSIAPKARREEFISDCVWAAQIHDLCRLHEGEDSFHGERAARRFEEDTIRRCGGDEARARLIEEAVSFHCCEDARCANPANPVFQVLKDADALDRGRFAQPCSGASIAGDGCAEGKCSHEGCAYRTLRLGPSHPHRERAELAWAARFLAIGTKFAPWPYRDAQAQLVAFIRNGMAALKVRSEL